MARSPARRTVHRYRKNRWSKLFQNILSYLIYVWFTSPNGPSIKLWLNKWWSLRSQPFLCRWPWEVERWDLWGCLFFSEINWSENLNLTYFSSVAVRRAQHAVPPRRTFRKYFKIHFIQYSILCVDCLKVPGKISE